MPTVNTTTTIFLENGATANVNMSVVEAKVMRIIRSKSIGTLVAATATNPTQLQAGTALFRVPEMVQVGDYNKANKDATPDTANVDTIEVQLNIKRKATYELETMDMSGFTNAGDIEAVIAQGVATAILADIDAHFLDAAVAAAIENTNVKPLVNAKYSTAGTAAELDKMYYNTIDLVSDLQGTVDKSIVGVDKEEVYTIVKNSATGRFIKSAGGGNTSDRVFTGIVNQINGVNFITNPMMGKTIAKGTSFTKDKDFDWSKVENLTLHSEAIAMPFAMMTNIQTVGENSGNPKFIYKYRFGVKVIRPKLVAGIFNVDPAPVPPAAEAQQATTKTK